MQDRENRFPTDVAVRVFTDDKQYRAESLNLSATGARLVGLERLEVGTKVTISFLHLNIHGHVVWSTDLATGVQFRSALDHAALEKLLEGPFGQHQPEH